MVSSPARAHLLEVMRHATDTLAVLGYYQERKGLTRAQKQRVGQQYVRIQKRWEPKFERAASSVLKNQERRILALLGDAKSMSLRRKATIAWDWWFEEASAFLLQFPEDWRAAFVPLIMGLVTDQAEARSAMFGMQFDVVNLFAADWYNTYLMEFAQPINQTTIDGLGTMLAQAQLEGWSIPTMQGHIETLFEQWMDGALTSQDFEWYAERMPPWRTELIARTETLRASNGGINELHRQWGVRRHEWLATFDMRTREDHANANGQVVAIGQPFNVGGYQMMYPGDGSRGAPLSEICNCRCTTIPVIEE